MANLIERIMDFMKLSYDEDYDEDEEELYEEPAKNREKKNRDTEKEESFRQKETRKDSAKERSVKKEQRASGYQAASRMEKGPVRHASNVSVIGGGNNMESEIVSIRPKDDKARQEIGDRLLEGKTVLINLDGLELDVAQRIVDFTFGVCYAIKGDMKFPSKYLVVAVPDEVGLSGAFENAGDASAQRTQSSKFPFDN
ncbi:MAG: cell division protein SepF [Lachnospiraceae bacterium]|nr:cell division protein SepF [Lachnospiraceae bacterium]